MPRRAVAHCLRYLRHQRATALCTIAGSPRQRWKRWRYRTTRLLSHPPPRQRQTESLARYAVWAAVHGSRCCASCVRPGTTQVLDLRWMCSSWLADAASEVRWRSGAVAFAPRSRPAICCRHPLARLPTSRRTTLAKPSALSSRPRASAACRGRYPRLRAARRDQDPRRVHRHHGRTALAGSRDTRSTTHDVRRCRTGGAHAVALRARPPGRGQRNRIGPPAPRSGRACDRADQGPGCAARRGRSGLRLRRSDAYDARVPSRVRHDVGAAPRRPRRVNRRASLRRARSARRST